MVVLLAPGFSGYSAVFCLGPWRGTWFLSGSEARGFVLECQTSLINRLSFSFGPWACGLLSPLGLSLPVWWEGVGQPCLYGKGFVVPVY